MTEATRADTDLSGLNIVVTGGSSGIGKATCVRAGSLGAQVAVHYNNNQSGANSTVAEIENSNSTGFAVKADLRNESERTFLVENCYTRMGRIDAWVHNAGADVLTKESAKLEFEDKLSLLWDVDVKGTLMLARDVAHRMTEQPTGRSIPSMVFIGWDQAPFGMEGDAGQMFGPTKAAVMAISNSLAQTHSPAIRINCVAPGWIRTSWGDEASDYWEKRAKSESLLGRWGKPEDVAAAITFLCSPAAEFINGQTIDVSGGWNRKPS